MNETQVTLGHIVIYLKDHSVGASFTDDANDMVIVNADFMTVVDVLNNRTWKPGTQRIDVGGMFRRGVVTIMKGRPFDLKVIEVAPGRTLVTRK